MIPLQKRFRGRLSFTVVLLIANIVLSSYTQSGTFAATHSAGGTARTPAVNANSNSNLRLALPRTSASQINSGATAAASFKLAAKTLNSTRNGNLRTREQQLLSIFEIIITTLEGKLKRIDNLGRSVEDLMEHIESLENRVTNNVEKTEEALSKLSSLDSKLSNVVYIVPETGARPDSEMHKPITASSSTFQIDSRLVKLDQKVSDIDLKLEVLKTQIDNNFLQVDEFNAEASEKKPITMNVVEITKAMTAEVMTHVSAEVNQLRDSTENIDKKLQFHINIESENIGRMLRMINDIHDAVVDHHEQLNGFNVTTTAFPAIRSSKMMRLSAMRPMLSGFSCVDILNAGMKQSGVFYLQIRGTTYWFLKVYCEQGISDGGWTVIQRRDDFGEPRENFNRDWADYKNGFGEPAKEFWLGNENIYMLTNNEDYALRVELEDFEGNKRFAQYSHFKIHSEADYYKLEIDGYEGNAGDSLNDPWYGSNNSPFSTYNKDNDRSSLNCASMLKGGWWWKSCGRGLNGLYLHDPQDLTARQGIVWFRWRGWDYTLKKATMMIRPRMPQPQTLGSVTAN
ncbi:uncharacterized protein Dvir_GJ20427 [Drosophila virilis]|uniref:Fibrinogen C-terminal domain-containing protein n=1 Tax=Drosophila virilis TaxID=7244 RepID=B4LPE6_DROVI|nr:uncharacterized protein Dvir_GJ20427 [Drosophila virilis]